MPLDDEGNLVAQSPGAVGEALDEHRQMAPPGYGQHVLDQLYDDVDLSGILTPGVQSGLNTPFYGHSRTGSSENLAAIAHGAAVTPAALSSRLQSVSLEESSRGTFRSSHTSTSGAITPHHFRDNEHPGDSSLPRSPELSRRTSEEEHPGQSGHGTPPIHTEFPSTEELSKVPSYTTATRTPLPRTASFPDSFMLPDYSTAMSVPNSPGQAIANPMETITEGTRTEVSNGESSRPRSASNDSRHHHVHGFSFLLGHTMLGVTDSERRLR